MFKVKNKVVVITGAASGMGRAYAQAFSKRGCKLALCDYDLPGLKETARTLNNAERDSLVLQQLDVADEAAMFAFADTVYEQLGGVDIVINNAGIEGSAKPLWATSSESFKRVMDVNYFGVLNGTRAFLPQMRQKNAGAIVNVSSIFGLAGTPNHADYCASKFAVKGLTEALMVELMETPIQVHLLHPGGINTNIARQGHSQPFAKHFFQTQPLAVAERLIQGIEKNEWRIVFGHGALKTALGVRLLPLRWLSKLIWKELKPVIDLGDYRSI